jgi:hypothetical protein
MTVLCEVCGKPRLGGEMTVVDGRRACPDCAGEHYDGRFDEGRRRMSADLRSKYSLPMEQYEALFKAQAGRCAICTDRPKKSAHYRLVVDHDHETGEVRGLLCHRCNVALGFMRDNPTALRRAAAYLEQTPADMLRAQMLASVRYHSA